LPHSHRSNVSYSLSPALATLSKRLSSSIKPHTRSITLPFLLVKQSNHTSTKQRTTARSSNTTNTQTLKNPNTTTNIYESSEKKRSKMSYPPPHQPQTVTIEYNCFRCGHKSIIRGLPRSPYPLWQHSLRCANCRTQLVEGTWREYPDSYDHGR